jgi:two-component system sensor histidine kinase YesM
LIISFSSFFALQISYNVYDEQLINQSSVILNLYSTNIESELRKMEALTFSILSDQKVQSYLKHINSKNESYERIVAINSFTQKLMTEAQNESYISSMGFVDNEGNEFGVGRNTKVMADSEKEQLVLASRAQKGVIIWMKSSNEDNIIIAARDMRATENMESLAVLFIRIDLENLINRYISMESKYKSNLLILSDNNIIYDHDEGLNFDIESFLENRVYSYYIENINDEKYLIYYGTSMYTDWTYVNILPYSNIFHMITKMRTTMIIVLILLLVITTFIGTRFANGITKPITILSNKMEKVRNGDFDIPTLENQAIYTNDEIGQLDHDFNVMINRINELINENYVKQLLIKETELKTLQSQIRPHFLYNTLASINGLAKMNGQDRISAMVKSLSNLLRCSIKNKEIVITIGEELKLLNAYITIQKIRYGERLNFSIDVDESFLEYSTIKLTLQPIVENSITYGLENLT